MIHRRDDRAIPPSSAATSPPRLPNARLVTLEGEYHLPWLGASAPCSPRCTSSSTTRRPRADGVPAQRPRAGGAPLVEHRARGRRDRRAARRQPAHRPPPRGEHPHQARPAVTRRRGRLRRPARAHLSRPRSRTPPDRQRVHDRRHAAPARAPDRPDAEAGGPTSSSVGWLQRQPAANTRHNGASRSCHAGVGAQVLDEQQPAHQRPAPRRARPRRAGSGTVHRTNVHTTTSKAPSANGSRSAGASTTRARRRHPPHAPAQTGTHRKIGLGQDKLVERRRVVPQVQAGAGTDLQHAATSAGQRARRCAASPSRSPRARNGWYIRDWTEHPQLVSPRGRSDFAQTGHPQANGRNGPGLSGPSPTRGPVGGPLRRRRGAAGHPRDGAAGAARCAPRCAAAPGAAAPSAAALTKRWRTTGPVAGSGRRCGSTAGEASRRCHFSSSMKTMPPTTAASRIDA